jgi:hypothetical protein
MSSPARLRRRWLVAGNLVEVTGQVTEFVPSGDPQQPPLTQLTQPQVALIASGQPLPAPVVLSLKSARAGGLASTSSSGWKGCG